MRRDVQKDVLHIMTALEKEAAERGATIPKSSVLSLIGTTLYVMEAKPRTDYLRFLGEMGLVRTEGSACTVDVEAWHIHPLYLEAHPPGMEHISATSRSQREQIAILKKVIHDLAALPENKKGVPIEELWRVCDDTCQIDMQRVNVLIKRLAQNGEVYSVSPGLYRLSSEG